MQSPRLITRIELENWSKTFDAKGYLPLLVSRLVTATTPTSTFHEFPDGNAVFIGGWDGVVNSKGDSRFVPTGTSLWEFGTESKVKGKADGDYEKRTKDPLGHTPSECTFIFLTPRYWKEKEKWRQAKLQEGIWRDIRVYDALNIVDWLDDAPAVSRWLSIFIKTYPADGLLTVERFWKEWAHGPNIILNPSIVTSGREVQSKQLQDFLDGQPAIKAVKAFSKNEAIAFIIASAMQFNARSNLNFFSRSLIVDTASSFRSVSINKNGLVLISRFEDTNILYAGVTDGHHILVPLGPDDTFNQDIIELPQIEREGQIKSLVDSGMSGDDATRYSKESARNITVLKRLLKFSQDKIEAVPPEIIRTIIPAMLIGRWDEDKVGDIALIEKLSGQQYDDYIASLAKLKDFEFAPFIQIGNTWRLVSPIDAWANLAPYVTKKDIHLLEEVFLNAFKNGNPIVEPPKGSPIFAFLNKETTYSNWAREGLAQSLILIGLYGEGFKINNIGSPQIWVDAIVKTLFMDAEDKLWISLNNEMPLIAEASPNSFFDACFHSLTSEEKPIMAMFIEKPGFLTSSSSHTGLLWALEGLAWEPEYLLNSSLILSKLTSQDPGGKIGNRPINSLLEIFKPWHYQTFANFEDRIEVLKYISRSEKNVVWDLLIKMLPHGREVAFGTHKMRWRMFDKTFTKQYQKKEILDTHSAIIDILISSFDYSEQKFSQILNKSVHLNQYDRRKVLDFSESIYSKVVQIKFTAWHTLREIISSQKSFPNSEISLLNEELTRYEALYDNLTPANDIDRYIWLFDDPYPRLPEGYIEDRNTDFEKRQNDRTKILEERRILGLQEIINQNSIEKVIELAQDIKVPGSVGSTLAHIIDDGESVFFLTELLESEDNNLIIAQSFVRSNFFLKGIEWVLLLYQQIIAKGYSNKALGRFLISIPLTEELFALIERQNIEIRQEYWEHVNPNFYGLKKELKILGIKRLIEHKRFFSAIQMSSFSREDVPTELIVELLLTTATVEACEPTNFDSYHIGILFEAIDNRNDIEHDKMIQLEWLYLPYLASYGSMRNPKVLHDELARNPVFFVDVLKFLYIPNNEKLLEEERKGLSDELIKNRGQQAYQLLNTWKKIPGINDDGSVDNLILTSWIQNVRTLAEQADRLEVADMQIGKILAQYPEKNEVWPPDEIANVIESINTDSLKQNYRSELFNKRGSSTRAMDSGGDIERGHAKYFDKLSTAQKYKHPIIANIFKNLAKGYLLDAKRQDEDAARNKLEY
jgi:hypothetical protein